MMMQNDDRHFQDLLADYAAPTPDDGFAQGLMQSIDVLDLQTMQACRMKTRLYSLYGAAFLGGITTALQLPSLVALLQRFKFTPLDLASTSPNINLIGIGLMLTIALWVMFDSKSSDIF